MTSADQSGATGPPRFSFVKLALSALGGGVIVLLVSIPIIVLVAKWSVIAGLIVALVAVLAVIATIGVISQRIVGAAEAQLRAQLTQDRKESNE